MQSVVSPSDMNLINMFCYPCGMHKPFKKLASFPDVITVKNHPLYHISDFAVCFQSIFEVVLPWLVLEVGYVVGRENAFIHVS